jgi:hypothetical protein
LELGLFPKLFLVLFEDIAFRAAFFPILSSLQSFSSKFLGMTIRRDSAALIGIILAFEE